MRLSEYLDEANLDDEAFAALIGDVSRHAVKKWRYGERIPEAARIIRIEDVTGGKVTLRDWSSPDASLPNDQHPAPADKAVA